MNRPTLRAWLAEGPFTLAMSAGFFGFYAHAGFATALLDEGLAPARLTGSSAGSMIAGALAAGVSPSSIKDRLASLERKHFWDPGLGAGLLRGRLFRGLLDDVLGGKHFHECTTPCAVSVWDLKGFRTVSVDSGELAPAVHASCALPGFFHPVKVHGRWSVDGGVRDRAGLASVKSGERVLQHHLVDGAVLKKNEAKARAGSVLVALERVPRPNPFALHEGIRAYDDAARRVRALLDAPLHHVIVSPGSES